MHWRNPRAKDKMMYAGMYQGTGVKGFLRRTNTERFAARLTCSGPERCAARHLVLAAAPVEFCLILAKTEFAAASLGHYSLKLLPGPACTHCCYKVYDVSGAPFMNSAGLVRCTQGAGTEAQLMERVLVKITCMALTCCRC